jgi:hypothetical protein
VGGAPGKVSLYVGKTAVKFNIPEDEAVDRLQNLMREQGKMGRACTADSTGSCFGFASLNPKSHVTM